MLLISGLWLKVDASRRRNDPRKQGKVSVSMVRFRSKSARETERGSSGEAQMPYEQTLQAASVGSKTRSAVCAFQLNVKAMSKRSILTSCLKRGRGDGSRLS